MMMGIKREFNMNTSPQSCFPNTFKTKFNFYKKSFELIEKIEEGQKIGKMEVEGKKIYTIFNSGWGQRALRWWYDENRDKTKKYLDEDFLSYLKFLDTITNYLEKDLLDIYGNFAEEVAYYNNKLITGIYTLKKTYEGDKKMEATIDSIILTLIDYKEKVIALRRKNIKNYHKNKMQRTKIRSLSD